MKVDDDCVDVNIPRDHAFYTPSNTCSVDGLVAEMEAMGINPAPIPPAIGTKGLFPIMELPSELRLEIYNYLLIVPKPISIERRDDTSYTATSHSPRPSVNILQTCKEINHEGIPILYSRNEFIVCLSINLNNFLAIEPGPSSTLAKSLFLRTMRWTSISQLTSVSFIGSSIFLPCEDEGQNMSQARPAFKCTGEDIMARFTASDFLCSPRGPDKYMALSISNWISMKVVREELGAFERALKAKMAEDIGDQVNHGDATS